MSKHDFEYLSDIERKKLIRTFISANVPRDIKALTKDERYLLEFALWYCGVELKKHR